MNIRNLCAAFSLSEMGKALHVRIKFRKIAGSGDGRLLEDSKPTASTTKRRDDPTEETGFTWAWLAVPGTMSTYWAWSLRLVQLIVGPGQRVRFSRLYRVHKTHINSARRLLPHTAGMKIRRGHRGSCGVQFLATHAVLLLVSLTIQRRGKSIIPVI